MKKHRVLFLCTGNSCRSQMAEAIVNARASDRWEAFSAGVRPAAAVHPLVPRVLSESGIPFAGEPKNADRFRSTSFDLVVTLCDSARQECPVWLGSGRRVHHEYPDPGLVEGTEVEKLTAFRNTRDDMLSEIPYLLEKHRAGKLDI
ncbi:MAG: arsenate reductase ArsC [Anaerolineales bacterium]|nr:arsenate reductase ArsC [Anaerolineales bacterium]